MSDSPTPEYNRSLDDIIQLHETWTYNLEKDTDQYNTAIEQLTKLHALKDTPRDRVSPDTVALIAGNLAGILIIVGYERMNIVTSKAMAFLGKMR